MNIIKNNSIGNEVNALLHLAHSYTKNTEKISTLGNTLLHLKNKHQRIGGVSELNNDGSPLQVCLSSNSKKVKIRLIADPVSEIFDPKERIEASKEVLTEILTQTKTSSLAAYCEYLFDEVLTYKTVFSINDFYRGACWIGASPDQPGVALYLDTRPLGREGGWDMARKWLTKVLPNTSESEKVLEALEKYAVTASIGLEALNPETGRAKIYWRLKQATLLSNLGASPLNSPQIIKFLSKVIGNAEMKLSGTVFSIGFDLKTGNLEDAKVDLCGHCIRKSNADWIDVINSLTNENELQKIGIETALNSNENEVAFLGMGVTTTNETRINVYLKPKWPIKFEPNTDDANYYTYTKLQRAIDYLLHIQHENGSWGDYYLPVGTSIHWITAYVGYALAEIGHTRGFEKAFEAAQKAATYLETQRDYNKGWGYNATTGADADSTAWTVRLFKILKKPVRKEDEAFLQSHWKVSGGFSTYKDKNHWADAHPCVTPIAFMGLSTENQRELYPELLQYLKTIAPNNGKWPSYWWKNHLYSTYHYLELFNNMQIAEEEFYQTIELENSTSTTAFELALKIGIMQYRDTDTNASVLQLLNRQLLDGRFPGGYNLRVTDQSCEKPWENPKGTLYCDYACTITTATVIKVLKQVMYD
ncbi:prenyltransferase/squalene oxidase repeat-containing protein [Kordia sp.]|uniref:prenyltransferase/squalene oxidase repeat-containing protein n=1 Tax=Kordia sp. TaxID=1965332 RepID=UPI003D6A085D